MTRPIKSNSSQNYYAIPGLIIALILALSVVPTRVLQGQHKMMANLVGSTLGLIFMCYLCWLAVIYILKQEAVRSQWHRALLALTACALISICYYYSTSFFVEDFPRRPTRTLPLPMALVRLSMRGIVISLFICPVAFFLTSENERFNDKIRLEQAKSEALQNQLNALQQQIDSHFLFNTLNILKANQNDEWVKKYVMALSNILRYQLSIGTSANLCELQEELGFVRSYLHLLRERFEDSFQVSIDIDPGVEPLKIPPYTLLTLVENAVKHNGMSVEHPLCIHIVSTGSQLTVKNTIKLKINHYQASRAHMGLGLKNLDERYRLIANTSISVERDANHFIVTVPLLS